MGKSDKPNFQVTEKAVRILSLSKYNAHTDPLFKGLNLLKLEDIYKLQVLKFYHKYINGQLPEYFNELDFRLSSQIHNHNTRRSNEFFIERTNHQSTDKCIGYTTP